MRGGAWVRDSGGRERGTSTPQPLRPVYLFAGCGVRIEHADGPTMALFSRRSLQQMLNDNAQFLKAEDIEEHVRRLNNVRDDYLSMEWEVSLLNAFSKVG